MPDKNPLDDIVDDLVVFKHEDPNHPDGEYFSNNPLWNDGRIRDHWHRRQAQKNQPEEPDDSGVDDEDVEEVEDYEAWTNDQLRTELAARNLSVDGKKADLVKRLQEDDATEE